MSLVAIVALLLVGAVLVGGKVGIWLALVAVFVALGGWRFAG